MSSLTIQQLVDGLNGLAPGQVGEVIKSLDVMFAVRTVNAIAGQPTAPLGLKAGARVFVHLIDIIAGFTKAGALADAVSMQPMVEGAAGLLRRLIDWHKAQQITLCIVAASDNHQAWQIADGLVEGYPAHCMDSTEECEIDAGLTALLAEAEAAGVQVTNLPKLSVNSVIATMKVGGTDADGRQIWHAPLLDAIREFAPDCIIGVGDCTDICCQVLNTIASASVSGLFAPQTDPGSVMPQVCAYIPGMATFNIPQINHPGMLLHLMGMILMRWNMVFLCHEVVLEQS